ncbi:AAA family ATPase [Nocardia carnea]|uniref:AAA family ATPase n=1 Tax=Nocardia carnea TaxID=37328 RepID=UPI00245533ED|nr:AAA family ATPase [Nocardia carnea]
MPNEKRVLRFAVIDPGASQPQVRPNQLTAVLRADRWDDFGYKTMYDVVLWVEGNGIELGRVKILQLGQTQGRPDLPRRFDTGLGIAFCSIGQDIEYYQKLLEVPEGIRKRYLVGIRDAAYDPITEGSFRNEDGWATSLLRFGQAVNALKDGRKLVRGEELSTDRLSFVFEWNRNGSVAEIPFIFDDSKHLPGRMHTLIGYNGVGKTTLLADLAMAAREGAADGKPNNTDKLSIISGKDSTFGAVIAVSYSAFDTFRTPESVRGKTGFDAAQNAYFGYVYCGLRRSVNNDGGSTFELKSIEEIRSEFAAALNTAGRRESRGHLQEALETLSHEPSFGVAGVDLSTLGAGLDSAGAVEAFNGLSTGHKIVVNIVAQLAAHLRTRSLVLIDEPETHLHPPLVAALLRSIQLLLKLHGSFAILATHSPVVVQELPGRYVRMLERTGNSISLREPEVETFAENIGSITRHVFSLDNTSTDYQGILNSLSKRFTLEEIEGMFENGLSVQGRALVAHYRRLA